MTTTASERGPGGATVLGNGALGTTRADRPSARRRFAGRISAGHLVMVLAGLLGMVSTFALLRSADDRVQVAIAAHDVSPGSTLTEADVRYARVEMDSGLLDTVLRPGALARTRRSVVVGPIAEGDLIPRSALRAAAAPSGKRAMSIPVEPSRAVDGDLETGDRVDVVVATASEVAIVVSGAEVLAVHSGDHGGAFGGVGDEFSITLAVDARESQLLTAATTDGDVMITRTTGAPSADGMPPLPIDRVGGAR